MSDLNGVPKAQLTVVQAVSVLAVERCIAHLVRESDDLKAFDANDTAELLKKAAERLFDLRERLVNEATRKVIIPKLVMAEPRGA